MTPLHYAVLGNQLGVVQLLLSKRVNAHTQTDEGHTPLHSAVKVGASEVVRVRTLSLLNSTNDVIDYVTTPHDVT